MQRAHDIVPAPITFEWGFLRADGSTFVAELSLSVVASGGTHYVQAILRDITERKRQLRLLQESLDEREILLRELHHRVKNNLQFIESLIELQKSSVGSEAKAALAKAQSRVAALATAYLAAADRPETLIIETPAYIRAVCDLAQNAADAEGTRLAITLSCEELPIGLDAAISIGLILRELLENSAQHGYGKGKAGAVEIAFAHVLEEGNRGTVRLTVRDFGIGLREGCEEGLGLSLVRAMTAQLSGTLELAKATPGLAAILRFPIA